MLKAMRLLFLLLVLTACSWLVVMTLREPTRQTTEQRLLADFPVLPSSMQDLQAFFRGIDDWAADRMHLRQQFITSFNAMRLALGWSPLHDVVVGQQGWLFLNSQASGEHQDAMGSGLFTAEELRRWHDYLIYRDREARARGAQFLFVMLPNKSTVYPEYWPDHYSKVGELTRLQQLVDVMQGSGVAVVDVRAAMQDGKQLGQLYLRSDTHWNLLGANIAQYEIMKRLAEYFPDLEPKLYPFHNANEEERGQLHYPSDLSGMMGLIRDDPGPQVPVVEGIGSCVGQPNPNGLRVWPLAVGDCATRVEGLAVQHWDHLQGAQRTYLFAATEYPAGRRRLLMVRDSFYEMLAPYFSNRFAYAEYVGLGRPLEKEAWTLMLDAVKPDVVIEEMLERNLKSAVPRPEIDYLMQH